MFVGVPDREKKFWESWAEEGKQEHVCVDVSLPLDANLFMRTNPWLPIDERKRKRINIIQPLFLGDSMSSLPLNRIEWIEEHNLTADFCKMLALLGEAWGCHSRFIIQVFSVNLSLLMSDNELYRSSELSNALMLLGFLTAAWEANGKL